MPGAIDQYREAKNTYLKLRNQARKELLARFNELCGELFHVQRELLDDFGEKVAIPTKPRKNRPGKPPAPPPKPEPVPAAPPSPRAKAIARQLETLKKKLADAQAGGKPTKAVEDRIYELEDEARLIAAK